MNTYPEFSWDVLNTLCSSDNVLGSTCRPLVQDQDLPSDISKCWASHGVQTLSHGLGPTKTSWIK